MPAQRTTRTATKPASTTKATTAKAGAATTDGAIRKVIEQEQAKGRQATTKATSTRSTGTKANGNSQPAARRQSKELKFRAVTLVSETYLDIDGVTGDFDLTICARCAAVVPSHERAQEAHRKFHDDIAGLDQRA
jgi:hypothetical protein